MKTSNKLLLGFLIATLIAVTIFFGVIKHYVSNISAEDNFIKLPAEGKVIDVSQFTSIKVDGMYDIVLSQGSKESVTVKGDYSPKMNIETTDNVLILSESGVHFFSDTHTTVYITVVNLNSISIEGVCNTKCSDTLHLKNLVFHFPGVGSTNLLLNTDSLKVSDEGTGSLKLAGKANYTNISDGGTGLLNTEKLNVKDLHVNLAGTGEAKLYASNTIYIETSGTGDVYYSGPAKVMQMDNAGTASVQHKE